MPTKVVQIYPLGNVTLSQNARSRSIRLSVRQNRKILVSFPLFVTFREAALFAQKHTGWIIEQQKKLTTSLPKFSEESSLQTRFHQVRICRGQEFAVRQQKQAIEIFFPGEKEIDDPQVHDFLQQTIIEVHRREAKLFLPQRLEELAARHGFHYNRVTIRNNRSNWGSCSGRNHISLNLHLMKLPDHLIDFILLHELAHTRVKNHGAEFYRLLDGITNGKARELAREVKTYSPYSM